MVRDLKQMITEHIEKGVLAVCFLIFLTVLILQLTGGREGSGKAIEEHIKKIEEARRNLEVAEGSVPDYTSAMENYWVLANREQAQAYTNTPFVVFPGRISEPQKELQALAPEKVTAVAGAGRNLVVVSLPLQQAELVRRASFPGKVLFKLYRKKGDDEDYILAQDEPYEALELYQRQSQLYAFLKPKLLKKKPWNPWDLDLAVALGLITPQQAEEIKKPEVEALTPTQPARRTRPVKTTQPTTIVRRRKLTVDERIEMERKRIEDLDEEEIQRRERGRRGDEARRKKEEGGIPGVATVPLPTVSPVEVDLPTALSSPLTIEDTNVEPDVSYQYKVEVVLESPEKHMSATSLPSNLVKALSDIEIYLRGGTELLANIEVRKWLVEVDNWISKSFRIRPGEAIGNPVVVSLRDEKGRFFIDAEKKLVKQEVNFSTGCTLVDLEKRVKFDPKKNLAKSPTLRMAYLNLKGGLEYKWTERRKLTAAAGSATRVQRRR